MAKGTQPKIKRNEQIIKYRDEKKMTFRKIGNILNITATRAHQLYHREKGGKKERGV